MPVAPAGALTDLEAVEQRHIHHCGGGAGTGHVLAAGAVRVHQVQAGQIRAGRAVRAGALHLAPGGGAGGDHAGRQPHRDVAVRAPGHARPSVRTPAGADARSGAGAGRANSTATAASATTTGTTRPRRCERSAPGGVADGVLGGVIGPDGTAVTGGR
jgi:hypothetical protein